MIKKVCCISDTHSFHNQLVIEPCDFVIHSGDILRKYKLEDVQEFIDWFSSLPARNKILVAGNHDRFIAKEKDKFLELMENKIIYLENSGIELEGVKFWGIPSVKWCGPYKHFTYKEETEERNIFNQIPPEIDILITHGPPYGILDHENLPGEKPHFHGSKVLLERVKTIKPKYHIFGHIHEAYGTFKTHETFFINATILNKSEEIIRKPITFEFEK